MKKVIAVFIFISFAACSPDLTDDLIPIPVFEDLVLNLSLPENSDLNTLGYKYLGGNAGVRGIIVYKKNATTYLAFVRNCSYQPNNACATVDAHSSTLYMEDVCCGSTFNWDGTPTGGPAWRLLRQYETILIGFQLTITDEIIN